MLVLEEFINKLSSHAQFSIFLGLAFGVIAFIVSLFAGFSLAKTAMVTFVFAAVIYLVIDFYETAIESN